ncbi:MAG: hypothetical protein IPP35_03925 [Elusimicrobia bacterium]|nr:hypothetical protein [Elusimicrobiota bacterium]
MKIIRNAGKGPTEKLFHHLAQREFSSELEMKKYIDSITGRSLDDLEVEEGKTPLDRAQFLIYEAWEEPTAKKRIALARKALKMSADCADAYNLLAEESAQSPAEALQFYSQGVEAGRRALGENFLKKTKVIFGACIKRARSCAQWLDKRRCVSKPGSQPRGSPFIMKCWI